MRDAAKHVPNTIKNIEKASSNLKDAYGDSEAVCPVAAKEEILGDDRDVFDGQLQLQDDDVANLFYDDWKEPIAEVIKEEQ